jgi:hypothetical protein
MAVSQLSPNDLFILNALDRNYAMPAVTVSNAGQVLDIELDSVPGYASEIVLTCLLNLDITVAGGGAAPSKSKFAPYNIFRSVELSLGGGPFQRVSGAFYWLREMAMNPGFNPLNVNVGQTDPSYVSADVISVPAVNAPAGATTTNTWRFDIKIPLQAQHGAPIGLLPLGNSATKCHLRLTVTNNLYSNDQFVSPLYGGTNVTSVVVTPTATAQSWVAPNMKYLTEPATGGQLPTPAIGSILNIQERNTSLVGAGAMTPIKFPDPFHVLRLWHIVIDGTGAPNTEAVTNFELDLSPGYPKYNYNTQASLQDYFSRMRKLYRQPLPEGVFVFDLWSGTDPANPNGVQTIDATLYQTLQTQVGVAAATNVISPAKIITFAETLSPVNF